MTVPGPAMLQLDAIRVAYPDQRAVRTTMHTVVDAVSLDLHPGQIGCLLGSSGSGKTTVLRAIAGFEPVQAGRIVLQGQCVAATGASVPPEQRRVGMMFQDYALFPHLDLAANVGFGLRRQTPAQRRARVDEMLDLVGLAERRHAWPHQLSGGQQQRVALARALAPAPHLLLLDEPFSGLDAQTREHLAGELRTLLKSSATTALVVTHDQIEAFAIADVVGVMHDGRLLQWAAAEHLYRTPADRFVAGFIGRGTVLPAGMLGLDGSGSVLIRPGQWRVDAEGPIVAAVVEIRFHGPHYHAWVRLQDGSLVEVELLDHDLAVVPDTLRLRIHAPEQLVQVRAD